MRSIIRALAVAFVATAVAITGTPAVAAAVPPEIFLLIAEIPGGSTDAKHPREIVIDSFSFGATRVGDDGTGGGGATGKVVFQDLHLTKKPDVASPLLFQGIVQGKHYVQAVLSVEKPGPGQTPYLIITMKDVLISSYHTNGGTEAVSLHFDEVTLG
ncbi:Hcp family type VI secretion system effector [Catelliglobosispora koreensis]|uniref:type VI secretion system tube protein Hcp n=1 Tax=Catelliglobosispora koreensis TaxID=129052 RepID=UPI000A04B2FC|nr:type VI secretion system tube protein Hcp [Catelliglobosispora koreensis]